MALVPNDRVPPLSPGIPMTESSTTWCPRLLPSGSVKVAEVRKIWAQVRESLARPYRQAHSLRNHHVLMLSTSRCEELDEEKIAGSVVAEVCHSKSPWRPRCWLWCVVETEEPVVSSTWFSPAQCPAEVTPVVPEEFF